MLEVSQQETLDQFTYTRGKVYCEPEVISEKAFCLWFTYCMSHRMVHAFTAAGLLTQQYLSFCQLARLGVVGKRYIYQSKFVYVCTCTMHMFVTIRLSYLEAVQLEADQSMLSSVTEVQAVPHYSLNGEVWAHKCTCTCGVIDTAWHVVGYH